MWVGGLKVASACLTSCLKLIHFLQWKCFVMKYEISVLFCKSYEKVWVVGIFPWVCASAVFWLFFLDTKLRVVSKYFPAHTDISCFLSHTGIYKIFSSFEDVIFCLSLYMWELCLFLSCGKIFSWQKYYVRDLCITENWYD